MVIGIGIVSFYSYIILWGLFLLEKRSYDRKKRKRKYLYDIGWKYVYLSNKGKNNKFFSFFKGEIINIYGCLLKIF